MNELLSNIYHGSDMSRISLEDLDHYAMVNGLNCSKLKDSITGHRSKQWKMMECFRDIHNIGTGYESAKGYCRAEFNTPDAPCTAEAKTMQKAGPCYICGGPYFQHNCTDKYGTSSNFHTQTPTRQHHKEKNYTDKFCNNKSKNNMFPMETLFPSRHHDQLRQVKICQ